MKKSYTIAELEKIFVQELYMNTLHVKTWSEENRKHWWQLWKPKVNTHCQYYMSRKHVLMELIEQLCVGYNAPMEIANTWEGAINVKVHKLKLADQKKEIKQECNRRLQVYKGIIK